MAWPGGLKSGQNRVNQNLYQKIYKTAEAIKSKRITTHIYWVPGHLGIYGNEKADQAAEYGVDWQDPSSQELGLSISFLSRKVKEQILSQWSNIWSKSTHSQHYQQFQTQPRLKASPL
jgi:hypothetical protein